MGPELETSFAEIAPNMAAILTAAQTAAARTSAESVAHQIYETGAVDLPAGDIVPAAFAGTASDGRELVPLLYGAVAKTKTAIGNGLDLQSALMQGRKWLTMTSLTTVADAGRESEFASIGVRPYTGGYVRMLNAPSCSRCVILAGKWFRWNEGFLRHPQCDCRHIPASENIAGDLRTDPYEYFKSLTPEDQAKQFGRIGARAIRDGADIYRVVNIGVYEKATVNGAKVIRQSGRGLGTARSGRLYGTPTRVTIDDIYRQAGSRTNAIRMMTEEGYITGPQVVGGNIIGPREGYGALGRGGTRVAASSAVRDSRATGVRDPLNRYTQTEAERRLSDAHLMMQAVNEGRNPWLSRQPLTREDRDLAATIYAKQINDLPNQPQQVNELARLLGMV